MDIKDNSFYSSSFRKGWINVVTAPHFLFPSVTILVLAVIWGTTLNLNNVEYSAAKNAAAASSKEIAETYEAQVIRALREIDQTLKVVKYAHETRDQKVLGELEARTLLLPDFIFIISIVDNKGDIIASTRPSSKNNIAGKDYFENQRVTDVLSVGRPELSLGFDTGKLHFSRRLETADGAFDGVVVVEVDSAYFVSGYEASNLGKHGLLGILGIDGVFRVRRSGETVSAFDPVNYISLMPALNETGSMETLSKNPWDGVHRYISAHRLYGFPLVVIAGLSEAEQLADVQHNKKVYLWRAGVASLLLVIVMSILGRLSRQLALSRELVIKEQVAHAQRVEYLAYHDSLTLLPNRSLFSKLLDQGILQAHRYHRRLAVLFLDLDRFKYINDTLGHEAGDKLLQEVARRLKACLRDSDTAARLGGDEFVVLLPELEEEKYGSFVAQKILTAIARPFNLLGQEFRITASIGISVYPLDGMDEQTLTKNADIAMYHAKQEGKNNFQFYSEKINTNSLERLTLESSLRQALEQNEFQLHYQIIRNNNGLITGMEALLRWQHPTLGIVAPMQFIPVAEETGLIVQIGKWVLRNACMQNVKWQKQGVEQLVMSVNLSSRQFFDENLMSDIAHVLKETGMDAHLLELEIAENLLLIDISKTSKILFGLKKIGVLIAIDDFGIGYSSLTALKQFPLDTIKIDRSFISDEASDPEDKALTEAIIVMGRALGLTVVAQGVETKEQADFLKQNACDEFQGFFFNKPVRAEQLNELLLAQSRKPGVTLNQ